MLSQPQFAQGGGGSGAMPMNPGAMSVRMTPMAVSMPQAPRSVFGGAGMLKTPDPVGSGLSKALSKSTTSNPSGMVQPNKKVM
jgi:hypothetical protein